MKIGIIPARYTSSRFPGKPLALIHNKPMIQHVYERSKEADLDKLIVATDDERIKKAVESFGGEAIMTSSQHTSGTDRCAEVATIFSLSNSDIIVNIQGDEPFIREEEINQLIHLFEDHTIQIATLAKPIVDEKDITNKNKVKVVFSNTNRALYFSRSPIPHPTHHVSFTAYKHLGIYAYRNDILQQITQLPLGKLEEIERLEQLRWLENNFHIHVAIVFYESISIDTPEDLKEIMKNNSYRLLI